MAAGLIRWAAPGADSQRWPDLPASVTVTSATNPDGERIHVVHNWSWTPQQVTLPQPMEDLLATGSRPVMQLDGSSPPIE